MTERGRCGPCGFLWLDAGQPSHAISSFLCSLMEEGGWPGPASSFWWCEAVSLPVSEGDIVRFGDGGSHVAFHHPQSSVGQVVVDVCYRVFGDGDLQMPDVGIER